MYVICFAGVVGKRLWCCSRVVILFLLFRFTNKKSIFLIGLIMKNLTFMYTNHIFQNFRIWCDDMPTAVPVYCLCLGLISASSCPCPPPISFPVRGGTVVLTRNNLNSFCPMLVDAVCDLSWFFSFPRVKM